MAQAHGRQVNAFWNGLCVLLHKALSITPFSASSQIAFTLMITPLSPNKSKPLKGPDKARRPRWHCLLGA